MSGYIIHQHVSLHKHAFYCRSGSVQQTAYKLTILTGFQLLVNFNIGCQWMR